MAGFLYLPELRLDTAGWEKGVRQQPAFRDILVGALEAYAECRWDVETLKHVTEAVGHKAGVPQLGKAQAPIRLAVTGRPVGPPLFESLVALGRERTLARLREGLSRLDQGAPNG
jgi:glutamyl-tRNA synthetase